MINSSEFQKSFNKRKRLFNVFFVINLCIIVAVIAAGIYVLFNPEIAGEFFGKIVKGFENAKRQ